MGERVGGGGVLIMDRRYKVKKNEMLIKDRRYEVGNRGC